MKAIVTGASSGIGREMSAILVGMGYTVYGIARRKDRLCEMRESLGEKFIPVEADISGRENAERICRKFENEDIDILINNAGFGIYGEFLTTDLERELEMLDINIVSLHVLTKFFAEKFAKRRCGKILNVSSSAGFMMGPKLSSYYASKAYVLRLTEAIDEEIRRKNKNITLSVLCPGPVKTEFDAVAGVSFGLAGLDSGYVAKYAIKKMIKGKRVIIPGMGVKLLVCLSKFIPGKILSKITYHIQSKKAG